MTGDTSRENAYPIGKYAPVNQDVFLISRAVAIQGYATLELSLSFLFSHWLGTSIELGGLVFFRITSKHAINRLLDDLKKKHLNDQYSPFWNSFLSFIRTLDHRRNEIVHWHTVNTINMALPHELASTIALNPPTGWMTNSTASINENDLQDFIQRCQFASRLISLFKMLVAGDPTLSEPLIGIFQQSIVYPPPDTHPLFHNYAAPES
jgi:hypothetical protein